MSTVFRGFNGKVAAAKFCRENSVPYLGICLGFQAMVVEYSRTVLKWEDANSTEFDEMSQNPVVIFMPEIDKENMGGTMRLGSRNTAFTHPKHDDGSSSIAQVMYSGASAVSERHRHRYEVNPAYVQQLEAGGPACLPHSTTQLYILSSNFSTQCPSPNI